MRAKVCRGRLPREIVERRAVPGPVWLPRPLQRRRTSGTSDQSRFRRVPPIHRTIPKRCYGVLTELHAASAIWPGTPPAPPRVCTHKGHSRTPHPQKPVTAEPANTKASTPSRLAKLAANSLIVRFIFPDPEAVCVPAWRFSH